MRNDVDACGRPLPAAAVVPATHSSKTGQPRPGGHATVPSAIRSGGILTHCLSAGEEDVEKGWGTHRSHGDWQRTQSSAILAAGGSTLEEEAAHAHLRLYQRILSFGPEAPNAYLSKVTLTSGTSAAYARDDNDSRQSVSQLLCLWSDENHQLLRTLDDLRACSLTIVVHEW